MLYVTTRGTQDAFTAYRTAHQDRGSDGGFFVPMQMPVFNRTDIIKLSKNSFGQNVADILNLFFGTKISAWDVDVSIGRRLYSSQTAGHRTLRIRLWDDVHETFDLALRSLAKLVSPDLTEENELCNWLEIGIRISVIFGLFGDLLSSGQVWFDKGTDVSVASGSFAMPMALWYARQMGLPINTIICGCNENGIVWDLLHRGEAVPGNVAVTTTTPKSDFAVPPNLERLIHGALGSTEASRFWWSCTEGRTYSLPETDAATISRGMFAAVVSMARVANIIPSVYKTSSYILDPYGALAYGALADYRARTGSVGTALLLTEESPLCISSLIAEYMHVSSDDLVHLLSEDR